MGTCDVHATSVIRIMPTNYQKFSPIQMVCGQEPNISHLRTFGCVIYAIIYPPHNIKMSPQRIMEIYVGYESPSIIKYLNPSIGDKLSF